MACRGFDGQVVHQDKRIVDLLTNFVCVRVVQANAMDLTLFQFDYDLTFAAFFLNADRTIYGRFGSRSSHDQAEKDISVEGLREALAGALEIHRNYPGNKAMLAGKQPKPVKYKTPEEYPSLAGKYKPRLDYEGAVVRSCLHCHQLREAERLAYRGARQPIPDQVLFPYPMPDVIGLSLDAKTRAQVSGVRAESPAAQAGFAAGDEVLSFGGQPLLSIADAQWVLHHAGSPAQIECVVRRRGAVHRLLLELPKEWRLGNDISWRATTWDLRRMATGGLVLKKQEAEGIGLRVDYVGQYGEHAVGKKEGFKKGDVFQSVDGLSKPMSEGELLRYLLQSRMPGARVPVAVRRGDTNLTLSLPLQ